MRKRTKTRVIPHQTPFKPWFLEGLKGQILPIVGTSSLTRRLFSHNPPKTTASHLISTESRPKTTSSFPRSHLLPQSATLTQVPSGTSSRQPACRTFGAPAELLARPSLIPNKTRPTSSHLIPALSVTPQTPAALSPRQSLAGVVSVTLLSRLAIAAHGIVAKRLRASASLITCAGRVGGLGRRLRQQPSLCWDWGVGSLTRLTGVTSRRRER